MSHGTFWCGIGALVVVHGVLGWADLGFLTPWLVGVLFLGQESEPVSPALQGRALTTGAFYCEGFLVGGTGAYVLVGRAGSCLS